MKARVWQTLVVIDRAVNVALYPIPMPQRTRLGSGRWETLCRHWHRLAHRETGWAVRLCAALSRIDCDHCRKAAEEYE